MLERTFLHIPGIGYVTERRLWAQGVRSWQEALCRRLPAQGFSGERWALLQDHCRESLQSLARRDHRYFGLRLPRPEHWRACQAFHDKIAFLDVETDGGYAAHSITVIGLYDGRRLRQYIRGENLEAFAEEIECYALLVTFNGTTFDLPLLRRAFRQAAWDQLHVDLRYLWARLGLGGGLKEIERRLGIQRDATIIGFNGTDAIYLWEQYRQGSQEALELLLRYNAADVENLEALLALALPRLEATL